MAYFSCSNRGFGLKTNSSSGG
nr:Ycf68 protein [Clausena harmandiana]BEV76153.1 Ycf68 protein [Clausena harmandiana]